MCVLEQRVQVDWWRRNSKYCTGFKGQKFCAQLQGLFFFCFFLLPIETPARRTISNRLFTILRDHIKVILKFPAQLCRSSGYNPSVFNIWFLLVPWMTDTTQISLPYVRDGPETLGKFKSRPGSELCSWLSQSVGVLMLWSISSLERI